SQVPDATIDTVFDGARGTAHGDFDNGFREIEGASSAGRSPAPPFVDLAMPRRQALFVGETEGLPAMLRLAVAELPDGWFIRQRYHVFLPSTDQLDAWAGEGSELAEAVLAAKLGEMEAPANDPALAR